MPTHKKGSAIGIRTLSRATILTTIHLTYLSIQYPSSSMSCQTFEWYIIHWKAVRFGSMITSRAVAIAAGQNDPWHNPLTGITLAQVNIWRTKQIRHDKVNSRQANCEKRFGMRRAARGSKLFMRVYERSAANSN